jgi:hypothetical protein
MMRSVEANLEYEGVRYTIPYDSYPDDYPTHAIYYMWTDGNYGCDCNRLLFIEREHGIAVPEDPETGFPPCGDTVKLLSLLVDGRLMDIW